jgi:hypothetical protein
MGCLRRRQVRSDEFASLLIARLDGDLFASCWIAADAGLQLAFVENAQPGKANSGV